MISGTTKLNAHIGCPTGSFRSPMICNPCFEQKGIDAVVVPMGCRAEDYADFLRLVFRLSNIHGALVTMPHKITTMALPDKASTTAQVAGSCNALRLDAEGRLIGDMFDGEGFGHGARRKGQVLAGARALVLGAGGVGSAIAASLARADVSELAVFDYRTQQLQHTNGVENFWRMFKHSVRGTHVSISQKHMMRYLDEFIFRANHRDEVNGMFDRLIAAF